MQIRSGRLLCGVDGVQLRAFLHQFPGSFGAEEFEESFRLDPLSARRSLRLMAAGGYVVADSSERRYTVADKAQSILRASVGGTYSHEEAHDVAVDLPYRLIAAMGTAPQSLHYVAKVGIYGSILRGAEQLGDLDVAVELRYLYSEDTHDARAERMLARTAEMGKDFTDPADAEAYLQDRCFELLRFGSEMIDLEPYRQVASWGCEIHTVADADGDGEMGRTIRRAVEMARAA